MKAAIVFVHGVNEHLPVRKQDADWRSALVEGGNKVANIPSFFGYYSDWFFEGSASLERMVARDLAAARSQMSVRNTALEGHEEDGGDATIRAQPGEMDDIKRKADEAAAVYAPKIVAAMERSEYRSAQVKRGGTVPTTEGTLTSEGIWPLPDIDVTTPVPAFVVRLFLKRQFEQLYAYFDNVALTHPQDQSRRGHARGIIRKSFVDAVNRARRSVGENGRVIVLAHSMGSMVAWDCLEHDETCERVDGLVTFGSPLGLDFVQRELRKVNGPSYRRRFPQRLDGDWYNLAATWDVVASLDTSFAAIFSNSGPHSVRTISLTNPDFVRIALPHRILGSAHSGRGYLRSPEMAKTLNSFGVAQTVSPSRSEAGPARRLSQSVERLAGERYRDHMLERDRMQNEVQRSQTILGVETSERLITKLSLSGVHPAIAADMVKAAERESTGQSVLERILGAADFIPRSYALRMAAMTSAVGQILIGSVSTGRPYGFGTGFLISPRLIMTNNHVLGFEGVAEDSEIRFDYSTDITGIDLPGETYRLRPDLFFLSSPENKLDYTIVAVEEPEGGLNRPWARLIERSGKVLIDQPVNIIQHPSSRRQELITRNSVLTFLADKPDYAHYTGDTEPGSSGSPCFNDSFDLAFLHHASVPDMDAEGQYLKVNGQVYRSGQDNPDDIKWIANEGIRISRIIEDVRAKGLSSREAEWFDECFLEPDLSYYVPVGAKALSQQEGAFAGENSQGGSGTAVRPTISADGRTSYLFEVSFGPVGTQPSGSAAASARSGVRAAQPADSRSPRMAGRSATAASGRARAATGEGDLERAVADLIADARADQPYYDTEADQEDADAYYADLPQSDGPVALFRAYSRRLAQSHRTIFGYDTARLKVLYPYVDLHPDGTLKSIYSGTQMSPEAVIREEVQILAARLDPRREISTSLGLDALLALADAAETKGSRVAESEQAGVPYNCEHVVPQSWFGKRQPMRADLHHLFTCERNCNSFRQNLPYGEFENYGAPPLTAVEQALREQCGFRDVLDGLESFEPERNKGVVARATLYFLLRYPGEVGDSDGEYQEDRLKTLLAWHESQDVTEYERHRNRAIHRTQGNRNPLVDRPELSTKIDFRKSFRP